jgi:predicted Zn-dependent protease
MRRRLLPLPTRRCRPSLLTRGCLPLLLVMAGLAACAVNPVTGRPELVLVSGDRERALGEEQEAGLLEELGVSDHEATRAWVAEVGARVAAHSPRQDVRYRFHVADLDVPNAFALPGGPIFVTRGLLALVGSEDELAGVLAHEVAHVAARHSVRQVTAATPLAVLFGLPAAIVGSVSRPLGNLVALPGALVSELALSAYGRDQEYEADRLGAEMVRAAGIDPLGLADLLERLAKEEALHREGPPPLSFFSSHPRTPDRMERVRAHARELDGAPPTPSDPAVALQRLDGLLVGPSPAQGVFVENDFLHPKLDIAWRVPEGWTQENHPEAVVAIDPESEGRVALLLQLLGEGDDPAAAAVAEGLGPEQEKALRQLEIGGRPAAQLELSRGGDAALLTWLALGGRIYRVVGICPVSELGVRHAAFTEAGAALRALREDDRARINAARLRLRRPRSAEALDAFARRTGSAWSTVELAVANDLDPDASLAGRGSLKVPISEPWVMTPPVRNEGGGS